MAETASPIVFVHPAAVCESNRIGEGTRIWAFAHVLDGAVIGHHSSICDHAYVEGGARIGNCVVVKNRAMIWEGVTIEDDAFIGPGVIFTNDRHPRSRSLGEAGRRYGHKENWLVTTKVGRGATIGAGAILLGGITIGRFASVAAGAVVTRDVADHRLVVGNPARVAGWVCVCGAPLKDDLTCPTCPARYSTCNEGIKSVG